MLEVRIVAVVGAGRLGRRIAERAALAGFRTILVDILPSSLRQARSEMLNRLQQAHELDHLLTSPAYAALERLETAGSIADAVREADLVIEALPDEMESKLEIFTLLDKIARPGTVLASTSWSITVRELAYVTYRNASIVGMRFRFAGDVGAGDLEIVCGPETGGEALQAAATVGPSLGMRVKIVKEFEV